MVAGAIDLLPVPTVSQINGARETAVISDTWISKSVYTNVRRKHRANLATYMTAVISSAFGSNSVDKDSFIKLRLHYRSTASTNVALPP